MPRLNSRGDVLSGWGSNPVAINGKVLTVANAADWFTDDLAIYSTTHLETAAIGVPSRVVDLTPANDCYAGGGVYAAWTDGDARGVRSSVYPSLPLAGLLAVGQDATLITVPNRQRGIGVEQRRIGSPEVTTLSPSAAAIDVHCLRAGLVTWRNLLTGQIETVGAGPFVLPPHSSAYWGRLVDLGDGRIGLFYTLYDAQGCRLLLQLPGGQDGYVVATGLPSTFNGYRPDARLVGSTRTVKCVWATTAGETPSSVVRVLVDLRTAPVSLLRPPVPVVVPTKITVTQFDGLIKEGWEHKWHDGTNAYTQTVTHKGLVTHAEKMNNPKDYDTTGTYRQVIP